MGQLGSPGYHRSRPHRYRTPQHHTTNANLATGAPAPALPNLEVQRDCPRYYETNATDPAGRPCSPKPKGVKGPVLCGQDLLDGWPV